MKPDKRIADAIREATKESEQPKSLSNRILAWFTNLSNGNTSLTQKDAMAKFIEQLYEETVLPGNDGTPNEE
jgi:hypothetical protein